MLLQSSTNFHVSLASSTERGMKNTSPAPGIPFLLKFIFQVANTRRHEHRSFCTALLKLPARQLSRRAPDRPINAICGGRPANDKAQNLISLKNAICTETMSMAFHLLGVLPQTPALSQIILCTSPFTRSTLEISLNGPPCAGRQS